MRMLLSYIGVSFLAGCFYIDDQDERDRLDLLVDPPGDLTLRITGVSPEVIPGCADEAVITVTAAVSAEFEDTEFDVVIKLDDGAPVQLGTVTSGPAVGEESGLAFDFTIPVPAPLPSCTEDASCAHVLTLTLDAGLVQESITGKAMVTPDHGPEQVIGQVDGVDLPDAVLANPANTIISTTTDLTLKIADAWFATYPDEARVTVLGCPAGTLEDDLADCAIVRTATVADEAVGGAVIATVPLAGLLTNCSQEPLDWFVKVEGHTCEASALLPLATDLRFSDGDCDRDGFTVAEGDCDDASVAFAPDVPEDCGTAGDEDCDDDANTGAAYVGATEVGYLDGDGDGYGVDLDEVFCLRPSTHAATGDDCDDADGAVSPGGTDRCDGIDRNCDANAVTNVWFVDGDEDGYGDAVSTYVGCVAGAKVSATDGDCDDSKVDVSPDGIEALCDTIDNDCDGTTGDIGVEAFGTCFDGFDNDCDGDVDDAQCGTCTDATLSVLIGESDVDCGGAECLGCDTIESCGSDLDCASGQCGAADTCEVWVDWTAGLGNETNVHVVADDDGSVTVAFETTSGAFSFGGLASPGTAGTADVVLARLDSDGDAVWIQRFGGAGDDSVGALALDPDGAVLLSGRAGGAATIDGHALAKDDGFLMRVLADGSIDWVNVEAKVQLYGLDVREDGRIVGVGTIDASDPVNDRTDLALRVLDRSGALLHGDRRAGPCPDVLTSARWDGDDLVITGMLGVGFVWSGTCTLPLDGATTLSSTDGSDAFVARLDPTFAVRWVIELNGTATPLDDHQVLRDLAVDAAGNAYVAGSSTGASVFGTMAVPLEADHDREDLLLARVNADGTLAWVQRGGSANEDSWTGVRIGADGDVVALGRVNVGSPGASVPVDVDAGTVQLRFLMETVLGAFDPATGAGRGAVAWPTMGAEYSGRVDTNARGNVVITGVAYNPSVTMDFGSGPGADVVGGVGVWAASLGRHPWP